MELSQKQIQSKLLKLFDKVNVNGGDSSSDMRELQSQFKVILKEYPSAATFMYNLIIDTLTQAISGNLVKQSDIQQQKLRLNRVYSLVDYMFRRGQQFRFQLIPELNRLIPRLVSTSSSQCYDIAKYHHQKLLDIFKGWISQFPYLCNSRSIGVLDVCLDYLHHHVPSPPADSSINGPQSDNGNNRFKQIQMNRFRRVQSEAEQGFTMPYDQHHYSLSSIIDLNLKLRWNLKSLKVADDSADSADSIIEISLQNSSVGNDNPHLQLEDESQQNTGVYEEIRRDLKLLMIIKTWKLLGWINVCDQILQDGGDSSNVQKFAHQVRDAVQSIDETLSMCQSGGIKAPAVNEINLIVQRLRKDVIDDYDGDTGDDSFKEEDDDDFIEVNLDTMMEVETSSVRTRQQQQQQSNRQRVQSTSAAAATTYSVNASQPGKIKKQAKKKQKLTTLQKIMRK
ncbi:hypothetical protein MIR68_003031 [Amoeboaphelidium protococcarum]|nr:hypothetical protein MIR68_003031 [Amoeboaphelidium protococcarum]